MQDHEDTLERLRSLGATRKTLGPAIMARCCHIGSAMSECALEHQVKFLISNGVPADKVVAAAEHDINERKSAWS